MIKLIKNAHIYSPEDLGVMDVLVADGKIAKIASNIELKIDADFVETIDAKGKIMVPGLIDCHVHLLGGGGEGGFKTRTPEIVLSDLVMGGITTVVGCLGTDGVTRNMESLVAKAYGLREEGISAYVYTGSYRIPLVTVTGSIQKDIMMIEPIVGIGEIAISDHRSSSPTVNDFAKVASDARVGGILSGKSGLVNIHLGDGKEMLNYLFQMKDNSEIPLTQFLPTHANRNSDLYQEAIRYAREGGYIDFTTSTVPQFIEEGEVPAALAFVTAIEKGVSDTHMTFSSDGQGSLPLFDQNGELKGLDVGRVTSMFATLRTLMLEHHMALEVALKPFTINPAQLLKLNQKGRLKENMDADILLISKERFEITDVIARGKWLYKENKLIVKGTFEK
ncbi:beta-aspartyl-peptidase [Fusibacter bizertensis]|uniref:Isoaspartyl dipeptidase n=1 Tax=Fusibacter bizertensis TaxID=1488331 RepID=A0ABT6NC65_9FIRM|nr:beta-aspartyl-peptidase [Fusibacter bizertensis]MDH8677997.1 beta-aspartyl-peptidase [Fusibacter bizertensis]